jgi:hypothetical protein
MVSCGRVEKLLSDYIEKNLKEGLEQEVQEHIRFCTDCFEKETALRKLLSVTRTLPEEEPSGSFLYKFRQRLDAERFAAPPRTKVGRSRKWVWAVPVVSAAVILLLVLYIPTGNQNPEMLSEIEDPLVEMAQTNDLQSQQSETADQFKTSDTPVEFVLDSWDRTMLENLQNQNNWQNQGQFIMTSGQGQKQTLEERPLRVYVMPVVQNQMAGAQSQQPY